MKIAALVLAMGLPLFAQAMETTCAVNKMHCDDCVKSVEAKVCDKAKYSKCEIKVTDKKKKMGQIHLVTVDKAAKVDEAQLATLVEDAGYQLSKCKAKKM